MTPRNRVKECTQNNKTATLLNITMMRRSLSSLLNDAINAIATNNNNQDLLLIILFLSLRPIDNRTNYFLSLYFVDYTQHPRISSMYQSKLVDCQLMR